MTYFGQSTDLPPCQGALTAPQGRSEARRTQSSEDGRSSRCFSLTFCLFRVNRHPDKVVRGRRKGPEEDLSCNPLCLSPFFPGFSDSHVLPTS